MNYKREKEYLENELKNYRYIVDMCYKYEQIIAEAEVAKLGISSPAIKEVIYENSGDPYENKNIRLNEVIEEANSCLTFWQHRREYIEDSLSKLTDQYEIKIIYYKFIYGGNKTDAQIANSIGCHRNTLINTANRAFKKMLKK
ncbi:MAG TPA: hypothetical protein DCM01_00095 [Dielma fastidiosa]|nr:hypothetical protein [Bacillota bacterium]HAH92319.1 hypothetical protein [Dielma fastidiosa]